MNKIFCSSCGCKNVYEVTKPKFCAACGDSIGSAATSPARKEAIAEIEHEGLEVGPFDLRKMKNDVIAEANVQKTTLTDLWKSATPEDASQGRFSRPASNLPNGDAMIKQSQADCASSKTQDIDG
ncbi:hypothetical protein N9973_00175 [bacterium]|nr:hypothetical protein [bacterium]